MRKIPQMLNGGFFGVLMGKKGEGSAHSMTVLLHKFDRQARLLLSQTLYIIYLHQERVSYTRRNSKPLSWTRNAPIAVVAQQDNGLE